MIYNLGDRGFLGAHFFTTVSDQGGPRVFFTHGKYFPPKAPKTPFLHVLGGSVLHVFPDELPY